MNSSEPKRLYAEAVLNGSMSRSAAFLLFINKCHRHPSQGAYRLDRTATMQRIFQETEDEINLDRELSHKRNLIQSHALNSLSDLFKKSSNATFSERLALLRLAKYFSMQKANDNEQEELIEVRSSIDKTSHIIG